MMKICWLEVPIFGKKHHWILFFLAPRLSLWQFQMPLERLSFMKTLATLGIINASDSIVPNITRIVYLCWYMFKIFMNPGDHADLYTPNYQNQNIQALSLNQGLSPFILNSLSVCSRSLKKIYQVEHFAPNILNIAMKTHLTILWLWFKMFGYLPIFALLLRQSTQVSSGATSWQEQPCQKCKKVNLKAII